MKRIKSHRIKWDTPLSHLAPRIIARIRGEKK